MFNTEVETVKHTHIATLVCLISMEQHAFKNVNDCLNTNIHFYLETSGGQSSNLYLNVVNFFNTNVN
jgi:hypothetical protein